MTEKITLEEALELVEFERGPEGWRIENVKGDVWGNVERNVLGNVGGSVGGDVGCSVLGNVGGNVGGSVGGDVGCNVGGSVGGDVGCSVWGTINGRKWQFVETPRDKLKRLIEEGADHAQLLEAVNQLEELNA